MRKPKLLLALLAGAMLLLVADRAVAERSSAEQQIRSQIGSYAGIATFARADGDCEHYESLKEGVAAFTRDENIRRVFRSYGERLTYAKRREISQYARDVVAHFNAIGCPPKKAGVTISVGGGPAVVDLHQITSGTAITTPGDPGSERPTARSDGTLTGESANVLLQAPVGRNLRAFLGFAGSWVEGSSGGETAEDAANTYIFANPDNESTGVAFPGGQVAAINSEGRIIDVTAGIGGTIANLGAPSVRTEGIAELAGDVPPGGVALVASAGFRYRNLNVSHSSFTEALLFIDDPIRAETNLETDANFFGGQIGAGLTFRAPYPNSGLFGGISGTIAFGETSTDARAGAHYICVPCGAASPEFDFLLRKNFDESNFSAIYGGEAFLGVSTGRIQFQVFANIEHMTDVPAFDVPFSPAQQPIRLVEDDVTNATFGARFKIELGSRLKSLATTSVGF